LRYGQFLAFFAPTYVKDPQEFEEWRATGAREIMRAVELGADADLSLSATTILSKSGERDALIQHLIRSYALANDEQTRRDIEARLIHFKAEKDAEGMREAAKVFNEYRELRFPYLTPTQLQLMGPLRDPPACAGYPRVHDQHCWGEWSRIIADRRRSP
jgi:hypothetical protein